MPRPSFTARCESMLTAAGFQIADTGVEIADAGVTVDFVANNRDEIAFYVLCGGTDRGRTPGCRSVETLKAAIAESYALHVHGFGPVLLLTARLPNTDAGRALLAGVSPHVLFDALDIHAACERLRWLAQANEAQLANDLSGRRMAHAERFGFLDAAREFRPYDPDQHRPKAHPYTAYTNLWRDSRKYGLPPDRTLTEAAYASFLGSQDLVKSLIPPGAERLARAQSATGGGAPATRRPPSA